MASKMSFLTKSHCTFFKTLKNPTTFRKISTFPHLSQEPQLDESFPSPSTSLLENPSSGRLYQDNWRNSIPNNPSSMSLAQSLVPSGFSQHPLGSGIQMLSQTLDISSLMDVFVDWTTSRKWNDIKQLFELWVRRFDKNGKANKPDVNVYNHYLRANLMINGVIAADLYNLLGEMDGFKISPNTASFNLVLTAICREKEVEAAAKVIERMLQSGKESLPDEESYELVMSMLFSLNHIGAALKYLDLNLKSGYAVSMAVFQVCVQSCIDARKLDTLTSIIARCKAMAQNKSLCPDWNLSNYLADVALQEANSNLAFFALEFLAKWIARGEVSRPPVLLSANEGLVVAVIGTAAMTYSPTLLDASWAILRRSLRHKRLPNPESYIAKINAHASLGNVEKAFKTLKEFESIYGNCNTGEQENFFSPFTTLRSLVDQCSKDGGETLDLIYFQLESLSQADPPYKSVAALNCVILGCANIFDLDRAYSTFVAIDGKFGLTPDIHSYNALICAFGKVKKTVEASNVLGHLISSGVKPNETSYSMLVNAHLINRDPKAALSVVDKMVKAGFKPSRETLKMIRRRCVRMGDDESDHQVDDLANQFNIRMGAETRRNILFSINYATEYA